MNKNYLMSFFSRPITNKRPEPLPITLCMVWEYITSDYARSQTERLRQITDSAEARRFKGRAFDYVTPAGVFSYCADDKLVTPSDIVCFDFDHLGARLEEIIKALLADSLFTTLLLFRSPSGDGAKWFIAADLSQCSHKEYYMAVRNYLMATYRLSEVQVDAHASNISRACFLSYDPGAYINPALRENVE